MYIEKINSPSDLKKMSIEECTKLAKEIRTALLTKASKIGGHLGSNLGMVDATIAILQWYTKSRHKLNLVDTSQF